MLNMKPDEKNQSSLQVSPQIHTSYSPVECINAQQIPQFQSLRNIHGLRTTLTLNLISSCVKKMWVSMEADASDSHH